MVNFIHYARTPIVRDGNEIRRGNSCYKLAQSKEDMFLNSDSSPKIAQLREDFTVEAARMARCGRPNNRLRLTLSEAQELGMIFTADEISFLEANPNIRIAPYMIPYTPMSGLQDAIDCEQNLAGSVPDSLPTYENEYSDVICLKIENQNQKVREGLSRTFHCPVLVGYSMGGMTCHALGAKYNRMSIAFNPLGHGDGVKKWVGTGDWDRANGIAARSHQTYITEGDYVSDPQHASAAFFREVPGIRYILPNLLSVKSKFCTHNDIEGNLNFFRAMPQNSPPPGEENAPPAYATS
jgi:hypothetical protein